MTTTIETENEKALRRVAKETKRIEKRKQVLAFAKGLGSDKKQAKVFRKVASSYFKLDDDGLKFKGISDKLVAIDSDQSIEFFRKKFPFLMKEAAAAAAEHGALDPADIALARSGNKTAEGRCLLALNGDMAALKIALADNGKVIGNDKIADGRDKPNFNGHEKNPFVGLRDKKNQIVPEKMRAVESLLRAVGTAKCAAIAKSAGLRLDGTPIPEKYI